MKLVNNGIIDANQPNNRLDIDPQNDADGFTNVNTLRATGGGTLRLKGGTYTIGLWRNCLLVTT